MGNKQEKKFHEATKLFRVQSISWVGVSRASAFIEVTADSLLIHQKTTTNPLVIKLTSFRRYGCQGNVFMLECGRRSSSGPAQFAFRCANAQKLFECVDETVKRLSFRYQNDSSIWKHLSEERRKGVTSSSNYERAFGSDESSNSYLNYVDLQAIREDADAEDSLDDKFLSPFKISTNLQPARSYAKIDLVATEALRSITNLQKVNYDKY